MCIAIHNSSYGFHPYWVRYCKQQNIDFKLVDCYSNSIIGDLMGCDALMWHHHHTNRKDIILAKQLLFSLEDTGMKVFPDFSSNWHFDDKVGQKYLLERIGAPLPETNIFFDRDSAIRFIDSCSYPLVHKLRHGAGSQNVYLVKTQNEARNIVNKSFGRGISNFDRIGNLRERYRKWQNGYSGSDELLKGIGRLFSEPYFAKVLGREVGYVYFQKFIPDLDRDYRLKVVANRCWGYQRMVRAGDFRASGSGDTEYVLDETQIPMDLVTLAFQLSSSLKMDSAAFDFMVTSDKTIYLVEISSLWGFNDREHTVGYWDSEYQFHSGVFNPFGWMVDEVLKRLDI